MVLLLCYCVSDPPWFLGPLELFVGRPDLPVCGAAEAADRVEYLVMSCNGTTDISFWSGTSTTGRVEGPSKGKGIVAEFQCLCYEMKGFFFLYTS